MPAATKSIDNATTRPGVLVVGVGLIVLDALLGALSPHVLFQLSPSSKGWVLPFQPGVWVLALLQALLAALILRGKGYLRYLLAAWVLYLLVDSIFFTSISARFEHFPLATARDAVSFVLLTTSTAMLFMPASTAWFSLRRTLGDA
jgi:hypothetical protein